MSFGGLLSLPFCRLPFRFLCFVGRSQVLPCLEAVSPFRDFPSIVFFHNKVVLTCKKKTKLISFNIFNFFPLLPIMAHSFQFFSASFALFELIFSALESPCCPLQISLKISYFRCLFQKLRLSPVWCFMIALLNLPSLHPFFLSKS